MSDALHIAEPGDAQEVSLARAIALLGVTPGSAATFLFDNRGDLPGAWQIWQDQCLEPHLGPNFVEAYECGSQFRIDEVQAIDCLLDVKLTDQVRERSIAAGKPFLEGKEEMKGNKDWVKYNERVGKGHSPGHISVIFALQSALYHLPLASALSAYIWFEFQSGLPRELSRESLSELSTVFEKALVHVATAVREHGGQTDGSGTFRVV
ncbi:MAG: urease accessory UreF family protein [Verrucomicrobiota bacterium]|nr:urease accessory UreF family protein [Verrucomicrobiota bacterium]